MRIDFGRQLVAINGEPMTDGADGTEVTLRLVCVNALLADMESDRGATGVQKMGRWTLATRIFNANGPLDMTVEEVTEIKDRVGKAFATGIVGPAFALLDGNGKA
jgi:hypothetical protein